MNKTLFLPIIILFFTLYYFVFPVDGSLETVWNPTGEISLQREAFNFDKQGGTFVLENRETGQVNRFKGPGFPLALGNRFFAADYGTAYICEYSSDGEVQWSWQGLAPISALSWNDEYLALGSIDGVVRIFDRNGDIRELPVPGDGVDHAVYGLSLSPLSSTVSFIAGFREQHLYTYDLEDFTELRSEILSSDYRRSVKMYGTEPEMLWVEQPRGLLRYTDDSEPSFVPVEGTLLTMERDESSELVYILSRSSDAGGSGMFYHVKILSPEGGLLLSNRFKTFPETFEIMDDAIVLSMDGGRIVYRRQEL